MRFMRGKIKKILKNPAGTRKRTIASADNYIKYMEKKRLTLSGIGDRIDFLEHETLTASRFIILEAAPFVSVGMGTLMGLNKVAGLKEQGIEYLEFTKSMPHNVTSEMNLDLWDHAQNIRADPVSEKLFAKPSEELVDFYYQKKLPVVAQNEIQAFLDVYGSRGYGEIDLGQPRWSDNPKTIITHIKSYLAITDPEHFPPRVFAQGRKEVMELYNSAFDNVKSKKGGLLKTKVMNFMISRHRKVFGMREYPKFFWIKSFGVFRKTLVDIADEMVKSNHLEKAEDIFFIYYTTLKEYAKEPKDLKTVVRQNRLDYKKEEGRKVIPRVILSSGEVFYQSSIQPDLKEGQYLGSPVSPGTVEGLVRVVLSPDEGTLKQGEILVCPGTDPSWTPLFQIASALVMEVGGMMTHGSVVAREHGIPGVVGVIEATSKFKTGQKIRVNGSSGLIEVLDN